MIRATAAANSSALPGAQQPFDPVAHQIGHAVRRGWRRLARRPPSLPAAPSANPRPANWETRVNRFSPTADRCRTESRANRRTLAIPNRPRTAALHLDSRPFRMIRPPAAARQSPGGATGSAHSERFPIPCAGETARSCLASIRRSARSARGACRAPARRSARLAIAIRRHRLPPCIEPRSATRQRPPPPVRCSFVPPVPSFRSTSGAALRSRSGHVHDGSLALRSASKRSGR